MTIFKMIILIKKVIYNFNQKYLKLKILLKFGSKVEKIII